MKKSKKVIPESKKVELNSKKLVRILLVVSLLTAGTLLGTANYITFKEMLRLSGHVGNSDLRAFIVDAATNLTVEAPVDPSSGDVYLPQAKLKIADANLDIIRYTYYPADTSNGIQEEILITSRNILSQAKTKLYPLEAGEFLNEVPHYQACSRAIKIVFQQLTEAAITDEQHVLAHTTSLADGRTAYTYYNTACTSAEVDELLENLASLQSY